MWKKIKNFEPIEIFIWIVLFIVIFVSIFCVIACIRNENNRITSGTIIDKRYHAAYTSYVRTGNVSVPQYHSATYNFTIEGNKDGEMVEYTFSVDETAYHKYEIGQQYP